MSGTKRGNNEGSIVKRSDGRWMARLTLPGRSFVDADITPAGVTCYVTQEADNAVIPIDVATNTVVTTKTGRQAPARCFQ
jgi:YVTN family beta-propeller protein